MPKLIVTTTKFPSERGSSAKFPYISNKDDNRSESMTTLEIQDAFLPHDGLCEECGLGRCLDVSEQVCGFVSRKAAPNWPLDSMSTPFGS